MRVFVSEYLVGGACDATPSNASLAREGMAMLAAVIADLSRTPDCHVITTLNARVQHDLRGQVIPVDSPDHEARVFRKLLADVDAVLVIAPETDGVLAERCRWIRKSKASSWNCSVEAIELCADKLRLAEHLQFNGVPTISTYQADFSEMPTIGDAVVLKPRDGAGSDLIFLVATHEDWIRAAKEICKGGASEKCLLQPHIAGKTLSVGVNISLDGQLVECLAVAHQRLSRDGRFRYLGSSIPARISEDAKQKIRDLVIEACRTIPGLKGYIGMDLILTDDEVPLIVEINPRLTTSYVGYRKFYAASIPERWLSSTSIPLHQFQASNAVEFSVDAPAFLKSD